MIKTAVKERSITLKPIDIRYVLSGEKTEVRFPIKGRVVKTQYGWEYHDSCCGVTSYSHLNGNSPYCLSSHFTRTYGNVGDRLWVRESFAVIWTEYEPDWDTQEIWDVPHKIEYRVDTNAKYPGDWPSDSGEDPDCPRWRPLLAMPRRASRITLKVVDLRVEKLHDISFCSITNEAVQSRDRRKTKLTEVFAQDAYEFYWNKKYGKNSWKSNPDVVVLKFKKLENSN